MFRMDVEGVIRQQEAEHAAEQASKVSDAHAEAARLLIERKNGTV